MPRLVAFKQADVHRAVRGASAGGMKVGRVEIDPATGKIVLIAESEAVPIVSELDGWINKRDAAKGQ